ncbi:hypothetical protein PCASD_13952 [Puccinia coronata f. sp. avenae]|uniref:Elongator complex protein 4 n=1 Tax=Puccinia coronata f. sp. avenae TaxID=200324 RepID=A0A2N5U550_9BASI|nr:hypothetical protein PCASD_13952 [Puccinia coronata f. sp. avenae]
MSSFKRNLSKSALSQKKPLPTGFHPSHYNGIPTASTGIASLDDLLGGGLPLSSSLLINEDQDGGYAKLMLRYSIAQGILSNQNLIVVASSLDEGGDPEKIIDRLMSSNESEHESLPTSSSNHQKPSTGSLSDPPSDHGNQKSLGAAATATEDEDDDDGNAETIKSQRMKIAWRYENLGQHHSESDSIYQQSKCHPFNLSKTMKLSPEQRSRIDLIDVKNFEKLPSNLLTHIKEIIRKKEKASSSSFRIVIQSIGSIGWPPMEDFMIFRFLQELEALLRAPDSAKIAFISFPGAYRSSDLAKMLPWATSASFSLQSFAGDEKSQAAFPNHQGAVHFIRLPSPSSLSPPATKLSVIRALAGPSEAGIGSNLGFKLGRRKGFRIEMMGLGLDLENENPAPAAEDEEEPPASHQHHPHPSAAQNADQNPQTINSYSPRAKNKPPKIKPRVRFGDPSQDSHDVLKNTDW